MKKIALLMVVAPLLLTSCNLITPNKGDKSSSDKTSLDESSNKENSSEKGKYDDYKDYEWYDIGFERYTDYLGNNMYYNSLIRYEGFKKGKYLCDDDNYGHYNFYVCENGDFAFDDLESIVMFDKSEHEFITCYYADKCYIHGAYYANEKDKLFPYYLELAAQVAGVFEDHLSYTDTKFASINDIYALYNIVIQNKGKGSVEPEDESSYLCKGAYGVDNTYDEIYVLSRYMNTNQFKYAGVPSFFSTNNITNWDYKRGYSINRGKNVWHDVKLYVELDGYSVEDAKTWGSILSLAGYSETSCQNKLDDEKAPHYSYEGTVDLLGFTSNHSTKTSYLKNKLKVNFSPYKYDSNGYATDFCASFVIEYTMTTVWDGGGTFIFEDRGLMFYYTDNGTKLEATIVNTSGELQTPGISKGQDTILTFFLVHESV